MAAQLPPPPRAPTEPVHRRASIAFVTVMVLQVLFMLGGFVVLGLGGTPAVVLLFLAVTGIAFLASLVGLVRVSRGRLAPSTAWAVLAVPVIDALLVAALIGGVGAGSCSDTELRLLGELPAGVVQTYAYNDTEAACIGSFDVVGSGVDVVDRYQAQLSAQGWAVTRGSVQQGSTEDGSSITTGGLSAVRGSTRFSLLFEEYSGSAHVVTRMQA